MTEQNDLHSARRRFLRVSGMAMGTAALGLSPFGQLLAAAGRRTRHGPGFGPLRPVRDQATGLPLLRLPEGFRYTSFGWAGDPLADGAPTPYAHDGMGIVRVEGSRITLVRNQEVSRIGPAFGHPEYQYDPQAMGGTVTLVFDAEKEALLEARSSLAGTMQNCAGGITPWGSWLSCEEFVSRAGAGVMTKEGPGKLDRDHGFVFEVPADGHSAATPLVAMGQFRHEAATVFAATGDVYLTEDTEPTAGFYRFVPRTPGRLADGGQLYMLKSPDRDDMRSGLQVGRAIPVEWVPIEHPERGIGDDGDIRGVQRQGLAQGAAKFTRLEGCFAGEKEVFFTATNGGNAGYGQVFVYYPARQELVLLYESPGSAVMDYPDNICQSPRGGLVLCQDSSRDAQHLYGLTRDGALFEFARNNVVLDNVVKPFGGDFRSAEWAGCCFSPDGKWLFANIYKPGFTVAITGPWQDGVI